NTLRSLDAENTELKAKLEAAERRAEEAASAAPAAAPVYEQHTQQMPAVADSPVEPEPEPAPAPAYSAPAPAVSHGNEPESATGLIALAQRVHDEYVSNGKAEADRILGDARIEAERVARDAEEQRNRTLGQLEGE